MEHPASLTSRYSLESLLGRGGMGEVYRATHLATGESVAIKALRLELAPDPAQVERFLREGEALRRLNHPNIVKCRESFETEGRFYMVLDYVAGGSLRQALPVTPAQAVVIMLDIADALTRAHRLQIVHRDVKPDNILLAADGQSAHLTDFGVAHLGSSWSALTVVGSALGTVEYMSPESCRAEPATPAQDIWALAVTLYELVAGRHPFLGPGPGHTIMNILSGRFDPLPGHPELNALLSRMLALDPLQRLGSMREVAMELERLAPRTPVPLPLEPPTVAPMDLLPGYTVDLAPGQTLWREGDPSDFVAYLEEGQLEVISGDDRTSIVFTLLGPGEVLGEMSCLDGAPHSATVRARGPVRYRRLGRAEFLTWLRGDPERMQKILLKQSERLRRVAGRLAHSSGPLHRRLAHRLLENPGHSIPRQQLAEELGVSRASLARALRQLAAAGLIRLSRADYQILDPDGLRHA